MPHRPLEDDLLDLIEGRLAHDRVDAVRAALSADPELLRRVERLVADRRGLIELQQATLQAARADRAASIELVREAIHQSEQAALLPPSARQRRRASPLVAAVGLVAAAGMIAGGLTLYLLSDQRANQAEDQRKVAQSAGSHMANPEEPAGAVPPETPGKGTVLAADAIPEGAPTVASLPAWINVQRDEHARDAVRSWTEEAEKSLAVAPDAAQSNAQLAEQALARVRSGGSRRLSIDEAAALSTAHHLRFVIEPTGVDWTRRRAEVFSAATRAGLADAAPSLSDDSLRGDGLRVEVTAPADPDLAGLRDALSDVSRRFAGPSGESGWYEIDDAADQSAPPSLPSLRLNDILWWSNGPASWQPGVSLRIKVMTRE